MDNQTNTDIVSGICRFKNIGGVTCYMNSILHILQMIPIFGDYIFTGQFAGTLKDKFNQFLNKFLEILKDKTSSNKLIKNAINFELYKIFKMTEYKDNKIPSSFNDDARQEYNDQNSQKFIDILISTLEDTIRKDKVIKHLIKNTVSYELYKLFKISMTHDDHAITPTSFKKIIGDKDETWNEYNHQDSQQFLNFLISTLEDEIGLKVDFVPGSRVSDETTKISKLLAQMAWENHQGREYSPLKDIFNGMTTIKNRCSCCSNVSNNFEPFNTLQVSIPTTDMFKEFTLEECLDHMIKEEQFDNDNLYNCELCGFKNRAFTTRLLWRTPKILIIHIKRFLVDNFGNRTKKLVNNVKYPIYDLDISKYICEDSDHKSKSKYNLIGINLHQEFANFGINAGHYTSVVKNRYDNDWYLFNDGNEPRKATIREDLQNRNAYMLFYYRE